jgi:transcriptional regulator with XRE-family HTH domain
LGALGRAVEIYRKRAELSLEDLEVRGGVKATHISLLERGQHNPTHNSLLRVSGGLDITVGELTTLAGELYENGSDDPPG